MIAELSRCRYLWEWLEDIGISNIVKIANVEFKCNNQNYSFSYINEEDMEEDWIDVSLYPEEFGKHSDFDFYEAYYGNDKNNTEYYFD